MCRICLKRMTRFLICPFIISDHRYFITFSENLFDRNIKLIVMKIETIRYFEFLKSKDLVFLSYICSPDKIWNSSSPCPGGEIGRRTVFRSQRAERMCWFESSPGHKNLPAKSGRVFAFMSVPSLLGKANECKNAEHRRCEEVFVQPLVGVSG